MIGAVAGWVDTELRDLRLVQKCSRLRRLHKFWSGIEFLLTRYANCTGGALKILGDFMKA